MDLKNKLIPRCPYRFNLMWDKCLGSGCAAYSELDPERLEDIDSSIIYIHRGLCNAFGVNIEVAEDITENVDEYD